MQNPLVVTPSSSPSKPGSAASPLRRKEGAPEAHRPTVLPRGRLTPAPLPSATCYQWLAQGVVELDCHAVMADGGSTANPYRLVAAAKARSLPAREVMGRVHVVRGFTAHQMEQICSRELPALARRLEAEGQRLGLVWLTGLELFEGEDQLQGFEGATLKAMALKSVAKLSEEYGAFGLLTNGGRGRGFGDPGPKQAGHLYKLQFNPEECTVGRSLPSYRNQLEHTLGRWQAWRRVLHPSERRLFDRITAMARTHAAEGAYLGAVDPLEPLLLAVLLEQQKRIEALEGKTLSSFGAGTTDEERGQKQRPPATPAPPG